MMDSHQSNQPRHGDVWACKRSALPEHGRRFAVMTVCSRHDPQHVTGYWYGEDGFPDSCQHDAIPLPRFLATFRLVEHYSEATPHD